MKIALLSTYLKGGAGIACKRLSSALNKAGLEANILVQEEVIENQNTYSTTHSSFQRFLNKVRLAKETFHFAKNEKHREDRFKFSVAKTGIDISTHSIIKNADVIHLHWIHQGFLSLSSIKKLGKLNKPIVWTMHDMWAFTGGCHYSRGCENFRTECQCCPYLRKPSPHDLSNETWRRKLELLSSLNITFVGCSNWIKELAKNSSLLKNFRVENIPNPIDSELFKPIGKTVARKKTNLPLEKKIILFGAMDVQDKRKGFEYLEKSLKLLLSQDPESIHTTEVLLIGKSNIDLSQLIPYKVNQLGIIHSSEDMALAYSAADVFVLPSLEDNLPNMIMEAMSCGTPIVAFNTGGIPEMIDHKKTGFLADYKNEESLAEGIQFILSNENPLLLSDNCRNKILLNFKEEVVAQKYNDLYRSLQ
jgi:glycosyltransferase involved in cell wall biosynthesis